MAHEQDTPWAAQQREKLERLKGKQADAGQAKKKTKKKAKDLMDFSSKKKTG